ncbi:MAG TPA: ABC transporter permease [Acidimicrobiales bacterium]
MTTTLISLESPPKQHYGLGHAMRAEITKLRTLRSTKITIAALIVGSLLITWLGNRTQQVNGPGAMGFDPTNQALSGLALGSLIIGVLGALAATAEYGSGTIRSSLSATPRRPLFLAAKVSVVGLLSLALGELMSFACFFVGQATLHGHAPTATLSQPGVFEAVALSGAFLGLLAIFGLCLGIIIRHTAGAISAFVGVTFLLAVILQPLHAHGDPGRFAPEQMLANSVAAVMHQSGQFSPITAFLWMVVYTTVALVGAGLALALRDA